MKHNLMLCSGFRAVLVVAPAVDPEGARGLWSPGGPEALGGCYEAQQQGVGPGACPEAHSSAATSGKLGATTTRPR